MNQEVCIVYTNWKGETALRRVVPKEGGFRFGQTQYHPETQWLLDAFDVEKKADRTFAVKDIRAWFSPKN